MKIKSILKKGSSFLYGTHEEKEDSVQPEQYQSCMDKIGPDATRVILSYCQPKELAKAFACTNKFFTKLASPFLKGEKEFNLKKQISMDIRYQRNALRWSLQRTATTTSISLFKLSQMENGQVEKFSKEEMKTCSSLIRRARSGSSS